MKKIKLSALIAMAICLSTISLAQNFENQNPYSIFGRTFVLGDEGQNGKSAMGEVADAVFVIQNTVADSPIARLEHNTRTGIVKFFDRDSKVVGEKQLTDVEKAWLTQDRFAEKYYSISPYAYAAGNPIRYVDINGDSVVLYGSQATAAFEQLNSSLGGQLNMSMSSNGTIIASPMEGVKQSQAAKQAMKAFGSSTVNVNIVAENTKMTSTGNLYIGGAFMGNSVNADGTVTANQEVNPQVLGAMSNAYGKPGNDMLHEVTEAYQVGVISQRSGVSSPMSNNPNSVWQQAHGRAMPQSGIVRETYYNRVGGVINILGPSVTQATYTVYPRRQQPVVIMKFP